jgi:hypothetical protein
MDNEDLIATFALIVSLIARFITLIQLLQQIFGTTDGYRRCQASIIGPWAKTRKRRFHWSELRIDTEFMTPQILLLHEDHLDVESSDIYFFRGDSSKGLVPRLEEVQLGQVSWLAFMASLNALEQGYTGAGSSLRRCQKQFS